MFRFDSVVNLIKRLQNVIQGDKKDGKDKDVPKWLLCIFIVDLLGTEFPINISLCAGKFTPPNHHKRKFWQCFISPVVWGFYSDQYLLSKYNLDSRLNLVACIHAARVACY